MKTALSQLPAGWREIWRADLQKTKKQALAVNGLALGLAAAMLAPFLYGVFQASSSGGVHFHVTQFFGHAGWPSGLYSAARAGAWAVHEIFRRKKGTLRLCGVYAWRAAKHISGEKAILSLHWRRLFSGAWCWRLCALSSRRSGSGCLSGAGDECLRRSGRFLYCLEGCAHAGGRAGSGYRPEMTFLCPARLPEAGQRPCLASLYFEQARPAGRFSVFPWGKAGKGVDKPGLFLYNYSCAVSRRKYGGIAQLARAFGSYPKCHRFELIGRYHITGFC